MVKCQICQHDNPEGAEYCENCGASLETSATPAAPTPMVDSAAQPATGTDPAADAATAAPAAPAESAPADQAAPSAPSAPSVIPRTSPLTGDPQALDEALEALPSAADSSAGTAPGIDVSSADAAALAPPAAPAPDTAAPAAPAPAASAGSAGANPRLVAMRYGAPSGEQFPLLGSSLVVGRFDPETGPVDVDLSQAPEAAQVSRNHAQIYREADGAWYVKDLGSTNGVFVKSLGAASFGPRLTAPRALTNGDEIAFGNARFVFQTD